MAIDDRQLSKTIAHALRHAPHLYELELDEQGWTDTDTLLAALTQHRRAWGALTQQDIRRVVETSSKRRFALSEGGEQIRALYGHSLPQRLAKLSATPPALLYHGTSPAIAALVLEDGLRKMNRQYVHLSADVETAMEVGRRKDSEPVLLKVLARRAHEQGVAFYEGNELVWLADYVAPEHIET